MGVFTTALANALWAMVVAQMNVSRAVSFLYLVPAMAVLIAWLWLGEVPGMIALAGGVLVIAGVVLVNSGKSKAPDPSPTGVPMPAMQSVGTSSP
jgi:drug/metabolite transporter (DMT)-like permease